MKTGSRPIVADIIQRRDHVEADVAPHGAGVDRLERLVQPARERGAGRSGR